MNGSISLIRDWDRFSDYLPNWNKVGNTKSEGEDIIDA